MDHMKDGKVIKFMDGKIQYELVDPYFEEGLACALTYGAHVHSPYSWRDVPPNLFEGALRRHFAQTRQGYHIDPETGLLHLDHLAACNMFLRWNALNIGGVAEAVRQNLANKTFIPGNADKIVLGGVE